MSQAPKVNDTVRVLAVKALGVKEAKKKYGSSFKTAYTVGKVVEKVHRSVKIELDCGRIIKVGTRVVEKIDAATDTESDEEEKDVNDTSSDSSEEESEEDQELVAGEDSSEDEKSSSEESEVAPEDTNTQSAEANEQLTPHGLQWTLQEVETDLVDLPKLRPKLLWGNDLPGQRTELNYFWLMYPHEHVEETIKVTNLNLKALKQRVLTKQEWFCFLGLIIAMACYGGLSRDLLWSKERGSPLDPGINFGQWMKRKRFEMILRALQFSESNEPMDLQDASGDIPASTASDEDSSDCSSLRTFAGIDKVVQAFNRQREKVFSAGTHLCVDESVSEWRGRDHKHLNGCPHVTRIARKPKGVGVEIKNLADVETGIMLRLELVEKKASMNKKEYTAEYGSGTAYLLRLAKPFKGSGRAVNADSAFASVKSAVALRKVLGLSFAGMVKTAHRKYPKKYMEEATVEDRGDHIAAVAEEEGVKLMACGWADKKRKMIVSSYGSSLPGQPHKKRRWKRQGRREVLYFKEVKRPVITEKYFDASAAIDVHNHFRQGSLSLETALRTNRWDIRLFSTILGMATVDAYLAYSYFRSSSETQHENMTKFLRPLVTALVNNDLGGRSRPRDSISSSSTVSGSHQADCPSPAHWLFSLNKSRYGKKAKKNFKAKKTGKSWSGCRLRCNACGKAAHYYCRGCSSDSSFSSTGLVVLCGPKSGRDCFKQHQQAAS